VRQYKLKKCKRIHGLHFAPDGTRLLAVGGAEARMIDTAVWLDLATGAIVGRVDQSARCYAVSPDVSLYVIGGANNWTRLPSVAWTELDGAPEWQNFRSQTRNAPPNFREVCGLAFDPTGTRLAIGHGRRPGVRSNPNGWQEVTVVVRDTGIAEANITTREEACVLAFNADGTRLAFAGGMDNEPVACVYDLATGSQVFAFTPPATITRCVQFLPDNRLVVANGKDVYVLPPHGGDPLFTLAGHPKQVNAVAITPDGKRLLTAAHDGSIRTWDANTGESGSAFDWKIGAITAVSFAPDGMTCAAAGEKGQVVIWDVDA
jgi:WD40 repeat protein